MATSMAINTAQTAFAKALAGTGPNSDTVFDYLVEKYSGSDFTLEDLKTDSDLLLLINPPKPARKKSARGAKSSEERTREEYDPMRCDCRVWLNGFGGQCTHKKEEGCRVCKHHGSEGKWGVNNNEDGEWYLGYVNGPRPEDENGFAPVKPTSKSGKPQAWKTTVDGEVVEKPKRVKKTDEEKEQAKEEKRLAREAQKEQKKKEREEKKALKEAEKAKKAKKAKKEEESDEKPEVEVKEFVEIVTNSNGTETEIHRQELVPKSDNTEDEEQTQEMDEVEEGEEVEETKSESLSDDEDEENEYDEIVFEGVEYQCHKESKEILDPDDFSIMGTWDSENQQIVWEDDDAKEQHESKKE